MHVCMHGSGAMVTHACMGSGAMVTHACMSCGAIVVHACTHLSDGGWLFMTSYE